MEALLNYRKKTFMIGNKEYISCAALDYGYVYGYLRVKNAPQRPFTKNIPLYVPVTTIVPVR